MSECIVRKATQSIMPVIEAYGEILNPQDDIQLSEATEIIRNSNTRMEMIENSYVFGFFNGRKSAQKRNYIPVLNIPMMSDDRWNELAAKCRGMEAAS